MKHKKMTEAYQIIVGAPLEGEADAFLQAWHATKRGKSWHDRTISFQSWEGLSAVLTQERYRLLRHLRQQSAPSISALARSLGRHYRRVHADVAALEKAGFLSRRDGDVRLLAGSVKTTIRF